MGHKVLIVDDDPDIVLFNKTVLEENGYFVLTASNGEEGFDSAQKEIPDLVVLDILMPRQSGVRMYRKLKSDEKLKNIPVIVLSAISKRSFLRSQEVLTEFGDQNVPEPEAYLEKPVEAEDLAAAAKKILS